MDQHSDALSQLRDIHAPEAIAWWPPAPGWWLVLLAVLLLAAALIAVYRQRQLSVRLRRDALAELAHIQRDFQQEGDVVGLAAQLSILLRRIAVARGDRVDVAGLSGSAWLRYLDETGRTQAFSEGPGQVLITAPYQPKVEVEPHVLIDTVSRWIERVDLKKP